MLADPKVNLKSYFKKNKVIPDGDSDFSMSFYQFEQMHQHFHFHIQQFDIFNEKMCSMVYPNICIYLINFMHVLN
jgi:hypothetical protein